MFGVVASLVFGGSFGLALAARTNRAPGWYRKPGAASWLAQVLVLSILIAAAASAVLFAFSRDWTGQA